MKDNILSKIFIFIPLTCAGLVANAPPGDALEAGLRNRIEITTSSSPEQSQQIVRSNSIDRAHTVLIARASSESRLIAQNDGGDSAGGTITPDKIRKVVEITLRQKWHAPAAADGAKAVVSFKLMKNGQLFGAPSLKTSAGSPEFDQACIDAAEKVAPFPALPSYLKDIAFVATFHAGKAPWAELAVDEAASGGMSLNSSSQSSNSGQSGWIQPSGSTGNNDGGLAATAAGQSDWIDPSASANSGQSGWTQPSGTPHWWSIRMIQPSGSNPPEQPDLNVNPETGELQAQPLGLASTAQSLNSPPAKAPIASSANKTGQAAAGKLPPNKNQKPPVHTTASGAPKTPQTAQNKPAQGSHNNLPPQQNAPIPQQNMQNQLQNNSQPAQTDMSGSQDLSQRVVLLNNNAVVAIADNNYETAIKKLEEALKIDPTYQQARTNLAIAYNNYGLQLKDRPDDAIKVFHKAFALDPGNEKTKVNLDTIIQYMGKNPKVFKDRLDLGNKALNQGDRVGARIEYEAALAIKPDPITQQKLYAIINGASVQQINASGQSNQSNQAHGQPSVNQPGHPATPGKPGGHAAKPIQPKIPDATQDNTADGAPSGVSQKLDTMYRNIKSLEMKTFGKPFESDDVLTRLSRLEQKLLGKVQQGKPMRRLDALLILQ